MPLPINSIQIQFIQQKIAPELAQNCGIYCVELLLAVVANIAYYIYTHTWNQMLMEFTKFLSHFSNSNISHSHCPYAVCPQTEYVKQSGTRDNHLVGFMDKGGYDRGPIL